MPNASKRPAKPTKADYRMLAEFRYMLRQFLEFSQAAARSVGLTPQQHQALLAIMGYPDRSYVTIGELAERLLLKHHSAVELADRLAQLGLLKRTPDSKDRRRVLLTLTRKAEGLLNRLSSAHIEEMRRFRPVVAGLLERLDR